MTLAPARLLLAAGGAFAAMTLVIGAACNPAPHAVAAAPVEPADKTSDWPMFGGTIHRNFVNTVEKNMPETWSVKKNKEKNVKWKAALGSYAYSSITVAGGRVFVGTNNDNPRDNVANELQRAAKGRVGSDVLSGKELSTVKADADDDVNSVKSFLTDLALKELVVNRERTKMFAGTVVETMGATTEMMNNPDREAGFRVLKSAKMPSVLIELAYVTNRADAANLKSDAWRDKVSGSIVTALDNYFSYHTSRLPM